MHITAVILVFWLTFQPIVGGQDSESVRVQKTKPTVYVDFVRSGSRKPVYASDSANGIWLRLHNNMRWPIVLDMHGVRSKEYGDASLIYDVLEDKRVVRPDSCHGCSFNSLRSGGSILFSIPAEHLSEGRSIRIKFRYVWEDANKVAASEPVHYVIFHASSLPLR